MKKFSSIILAVILIGVSSLIAWSLINNKTTQTGKVATIKKSVYTQTVQNGKVPVIIETSGNLIAKNKIELYAEVQGVLRFGNKDFKPGTYYDKGETILNINNDEQAALLQTTKTAFFNALTSIMPDIKLDFADEYDKWQKYLVKFDINKSIEPLPETKSDKEKFFISTRNVLSSYYNYKNLEVRLEKYVIRAPYSGVLTEAMVSNGTLVRSGQRLGEFIDPTVYELEVSINQAYSNLLELGSSVELKNLQETETWTGKVIRQNAKTDLSSQTTKAYIQVSGKGLSEGMYLQAKLNTGNVEDAIEINRNLLVDNSALFLVEDSTLMLTKVLPVYFNNEKVIVKGLTNGSQILARPIIGAYSGMPVKIINN